MSSRIAALEAELADLKRQLLHTRHPAAAHDGDADDDAHAGLRYEVAQTYVKANDDLVAKDGGPATTGLSLHDETEAVAMAHRVSVLVLESGSLRAEHEVLNALVPEGGRKK